MTMKYITTKFLLSVLFIAIAFACSDDVRIPDFEDGPNVRIIVDANSAAINFFSDISQAKIKYDLYSENKDIDVVDIRVQRNGTGTPVSIVKFAQADFDSGNGQIK